MSLLLLFFLWALFGMCFLVITMLWTLRSDKVQYQTVRKGARAITTVCLVIMALILGGTFLMPICDC